MVSTRFVLVITFWSYQCLPDFLMIRENIALRQSLTNPYNICIFKNIHNSGKSTGKAVKAYVAMHHHSNDCVCGHYCQSWLGPQFWPGSPILVFDGNCL